MAPPTRNEVVASKAIKKIRRLPINEVLHKDIRKLKHGFGFIRNYMIEFVVVLQAFGSVQFKIEQ
jgi:hypothetical protein